MLARRHWKYFIYVFMTLYVAYVAISMYLLNNLTHSGQDYAIMASREIRELRTRANEFSATMPLLLASPELSLDEIEKKISSESAAQRQTFNRLRERFLGDPAIIVNLGDILEKIAQKKREAAFKFHPNISYELATTYYQNEMAPLMKELRRALDAAHHSVDMTHNEVHELMHQRLDLVILVTVVVGIIIVFMTMLYDRRMAISSRELAYRNELFRQLARGVDEIFIIAITEDRFEFISQNFEHIMGLPPTPLHKYPAKLYSALEPGDARWLQDILASQPHADYHAERDITGFDANRFFKIRIYTIRVPSTRQMRFIIVISDETKAKEHQIALNNALESAKAASAAKSSFLSHMSHEIRTPMNAIIGMTTIALSRMQDSERVRDCLQKISNSSRHLLGLINDVLDMSKIESGKLSINENKFNLRLAIENIRALVQPQIQAKGHKFEILLKNAVEENFIGDVMRLRQVLVNILSNAIKFTPNGGSIVMEIEQSPLSHNMTQIRFTVTDNGIGMSQDFLKRIYVPFEQAHSSMASLYGGTGLGMPITASLITMMGGTISVASQEGKGTTFRVDLPFTLSGEPACVKNELPPLKVLIVDDDQDICENAAFLLAQMGLSPAWATSGEKAVELVASHCKSDDKIDICIIKWDMPQMNGAETSQRIRSIQGAEPVAIIISVYDWADIEDEARKAGISNFISKPFFASSLFEGLCEIASSIADHPEKDNAQDEDKPAQGYDFAGYRLLLAEDNEFNREIAQEFLEMANAEVEHAENGQEALEKFVSSQPGYYDLILMDIQMPVMDGYTSTRSIRASQHPEAGSIPIIAMTANAFSEDVAQAMNAGMNAHLAKPIDIHALYKMLAKYLPPAWGCTNRPA